MDREEALQLLKSGPSGVRRWNELRKREFIVPEMRNANLDRADLKGVNLINADLEGASLNESNLQGANLACGKLATATFGLADLRGAVLSHADLWSVVLHGADLRWSHLVRTNLDGAHVSDANFSNAIAGYTVFPSALGEARGLNKMSHQGYSTVPTAALRGFVEVVPEKFLRGCGLSNSDIEYAKGQLGGVLFYSAFISYTEADAEFARRLHADLQVNGIRCWFAPEDLKGGDFILRGVNEAIRLHDKLIVIFSENSLQKDWLEHETSKALEKEAQGNERVLIPIMLDRSVLDLTLGWAKQITDATKPTGRLMRDFSGWKDHDAYQEAFQKLLGDLKQ